VVLVEESVLVKTLVMCSYFDERCVGLGWLMYGRREKGGCLEERVLLYTLRQWVNLLN